MKYVQPWVPPPTLQNESVRTSRLSIALMCSFSCVVPESLKEHSLLFITFWVLFHFLIGVKICSGGQPAS